MGNQDYGASEPPDTQGGPSEPPQNPGSKVQSRQQPTLLTWQDLKDLPGQVLPDETRMHLKNAGREAMLALYTLVKNINRARNESSGESSAGKVRKHIDVE